MPNRTRRSLMPRLGAVLVIALALWFGLRSDDSANRGVLPDATVSAAVPAQTTASTPAEALAGTAAQRVAIGFRSPTRLAEHYQKHGREFGDASEAEYLQMAQALRDATAGGDVLEAVRPADGVISRFDRASGAFLAFDADGTIRTFFKPNDGEAYFRRQAKRRPAP